MQLFKLLSLITVYHPYTSYIRLPLLLLSETQTGSTPLTNSNVLLITLLKLVGNRTKDTTEMERFFLHKDFSYIMFLSGRPMWHPEVLMRRLLHSQTLFPGWKIKYLGIYYKRIAIISEKDNTFSRNFSLSFRLSWKEVLEYPSLLKNNLREILF